MERFKIISVLAWWLMMSGAALTQQPTSKFTVMVMDINDARVVGARVVIEGNRETRTVTTGIAGTTYPLELPPGIYRIEVSQPGFCRNRRAAFRIRPSIETSVSLQLIVCPTHLYEKPFSEESFAIKSSGVSLDLLIQFIEKSSSNRSGSRDLVQYASGKTVFVELPKAVASYDSLTVYALKMRFDPKKLKLEAEGEVVIEDKGRRRAAARAAVDFSANEPAITLDPKNVSLQ